MEQPPGAGAPDQGQGRDDAQPGGNDGRNSRDVKGQPEASDEVGVGQDVAISVEAQGGHPGGREISEALKPPQGEPPAEKPEHHPQGRGQGKPDPCRAGPDRRPALVTAENRDHRPFKTCRSQPRSRATRSSDGSSGIR